MRMCEQFDNGLLADAITILTIYDDPQRIRLDVMQRIYADSQNFQEKAHLQILPTA